MATIIIPDKICPHCGGNTWYTVGKKYFICKKKRIEQNKKYAIIHRDNINSYRREWRRKNPERTKELNKYYRSKYRERVKATKRKYSRRIVDKMSDSYIKKCIKDAIRMQNKKGEIKVIVSSQDISQDQVNKYRESLIRSKEIRNDIKKQMIMETMEDYNNLVAVGTTENENDTLTNNLNSLQEQYDKLTEYMKSASFRTCSHKGSVYNKRSTLKGKINVFKEALGMPLLVSGFTKSTIKTPIVKEVVIPKETTPKSVIDEYRELEARRKEILDDVNQFNEYLESLKLVLT